MSTFEDDFFKRTGKRLEDCSEAEILAEIGKLQAEASEHRQHATELRHYGATRDMTPAGNDNGQAGGDAA